MITLRQQIALAILANPESWIAKIELEDMCRYLSEDPSNYQTITDQIILTQRYAAVYISNQVDKIHELLQ